MNNVVKNSKTSSKKSITAKQLAKSNLTKRKNPDWDNLDRGYRYLTLDMKLPHDQAIAVMGNVVEESLGNYKATLKNGNGKGLIQWDGREVPNGRYGLWGSIWASVAKPANVYDATTDTMKNYWAPWRGLKGDKVRLEFIKAPLKQKTLIYAESYLRPGKPRIADRQLSAMQLDSIYNPRIKNIIVQKQGGQIRKMQTAAGGPIRRIKFTPEQIAEFENQAAKVPGTNNSGGNRYREEGVLALLHLEQEAKRKEEEIKSRMEMRPTLKRKVTTAEKLQGKKDEYELKPQIVGMSGADPLLSFYVGGVGLNGIGALAKTGLWNVAKYAPTTQLGNWGRGYFVGNTFKNSFNGAVPTLTSQATSLLYLPAKLNESGLTSLKFFERPTLSNAQELAGATKWERNFKPKWHVANYPGYLLKGLMKGSLLEKQLSKNGTINVNLLNAYFNKASQIEKDVASKVLNEQFTGLKVIDYNKFKKAVLDELIGKYNRNYNALSMIPTMTTEKMMAYGGDRLGIIKNFKDIPDGIGGLVTTWTEELPVLFKQFTFETPKISIGNRKHYSGQPIGHTRTFTNQQEPLILHVMESQSDWAQKSLGLTKAEKTAIQNIDEQLKTGTPTGFSTLEELQVQKQTILDRASQRTQGISYLSLHLHDNYLQRLLQENLRYAAENGLTKMRYPTSETAAKIEGYLSKTGWFTPEGKELNPLTSVLYNPETGNFEAPVGTIIKLVYSPEHQTILKKYADFPKLFLKLFKDQKVRIVTDDKGNTWYEVDVPKGYLSREWLFKQGGKMNILEFLKNGSGIHIKKKNRGKFTSYCGGKVTDECIRKAKASGNPTLIKRATFAANARKWKHEKGGKAFIEGVNVLDSNPNAYKYVKKKIKKNLLGGNVYSGLISTGLNAGLDIYSAYKKKEAANELAKALDKSTEVSQLELYAKYFLEEMEKLNNETLPDGIHSSNAFKSYVAHQRANKRALADAQKLKSLNELEKALLLSLANQQVTSSIINGVSSLGLMLLNTKFSNKGNANNGAPSTTTGNIANGGSYNAGSWTSPSTSNKTYF